MLWANPATCISFLLFMLLLAGVTYSAADLEEALSIFKKYRELFYLVIVFSLLKTRPQTAIYGEYGFILGCLVLMTLSYAMYFSLIPTQKFGYSVVYHITHSFFMALLGFWSLQKAFEKKWYRYLWLIVTIAAAVNIFFIAPGRTGMLVYLTLLVLTLFQRMRWKYSIPATLVASMIVATTYLASDNFSTRVNEAIDEIQNYQSTVSRTSLGMRFDWWQNSIELIKQKPLLGHGTGSFSTVQATLVEGTETKPSDNPHNEYLLITVQTGFVGLALFLGLLILLLHNSLRLVEQKKYLLQGVVVAMGTGCLMNSFLLDSHQGHFFAFVSALLCVSQKASEETDSEIIDAMVSKPRTNSPATT